jgi:hypothetical protein
MIESFSPTRAFMMVDLPTFGLPIMFTKPDLCDILFELGVPSLSGNLN